MKNSKFKIGIWLGLFNFAFLILNCSAEITATVYPGYQFSSNERPTTANLNALGRPTILVSGTLGGTNVALAANSVTTTMMSDTLPGSNLLWDASSPRKLVIADSGIGTNQIATNIAGLGLAGGGGLPLSLNVDTNTVQITNDVVTLNLTTFSNLVSVISSNIANYYLTNFALLSTNQATIAEFAIPAAGTVVTNTHSLGVVPTHARWVLRCITADLGYVPGDEVEAYTAGYWSTEDTPAFTFWVNSTNCGVARTTRATSGNINLFTRTGTSTEDGITEARWKLKGYLRP